MKRQLVDRLGDQFLFCCKRPRWAGFNARPGQDTWWCHAQQQEKIRKTIWERFA